jgi:hypothetical protein
MFKEHVPKLASCILEPLRKYPADMGCYAVSTGK